MSAVAPAMAVSLAALAALPPAHAADAFPGSTRSYYLTDTATGALARAASRDARAAAVAGIVDALVVLDAGDPADPGHVVLPGSGRRRSVGDLRRAVSAYARAWQGSRNRPHLTLVVTAAAHGDRVDRAAGTAWGRMVTTLARAAPGVDVRGGLDVEVEWSPARAVRSWLAGYLAATARPFVDVGSCTCPPYARLGVGWTLSDRVDVATAGGRGSVVPQIYARAGGSAEEWAALARWARARHRPRLRIEGVLTEQAACTGPPRRACAGIDLDPASAWRQVVARTGQTPRWVTDIGYLGAGGVVHPGAVPAVALAAGLLVLAAVASMLALLAWRSRWRRPLRRRTAGRARAHRRSRTRRRRGRRSR